MMSVSEQLTTRYARHSRELVADHDTDPIFVSIASYRDPELGPTIEDCLAKARWPHRLRFGICWQHGPEEKAPSRFGDLRFRVVDVDWRDSRGACWARAQIMGLWDQEPWYLQLDSHHRFVPEWDVKLFAQMAATGSPKPILTTYAAPFAPGDTDSLKEEPMQMEFHYFTEDGLVLFRPGVIPDWQSTTAPRRARFASAHFLFAPGSLVSEVPYDPELYFIGEEITLTVRAFTHGYDLFHPGESIVWHEYTRNYRNKHWDDHIADHGVDVDWAQRDAPSRESARQLLTETGSQEFGLGRERSVADYEAYAGINFEHRRVQDYTRHHFPPPNPPVAEDWIAKTKDHTVRITIAASQVAPSVWTDSQFWYVGVRDSEGAEIVRIDAEGKELLHLLADAPEQITLVRQFESTAAPARWEVRPHVAADGWLDSLEGALIGDGRGHWENASGSSLTLAMSHRDTDDATALGECCIPLSCYPRVTPSLDWSETEGGFVATEAGIPTQFVVNKTGVLVLELSNGRHSVAEIIGIVQDAFTLPRPPHAQVTEFLDLASRHHLVHVHSPEKGIQK